jgi:ELWxxDGT repeat protein
MLLAALVFAAAAASSAAQRLQAAGTQPTLFWADDGHGLALWRTDGTAGGTALVRGFDPDRPGVEARRLAPLRRPLVFSQRDAEHGDELWKTDGTPQGTVLIKDIRPGRAGSGAAAVGQIGDEVLFFANDDVHGRQLWKTNGTGPGTVRLTRLPGLGYQLAPSSAAATGAIYFAAYDAGLRLQLWRSDGTARGTRLLRIHGLSASGDLRWLVPSGRRLFFFVDGHELWSTDGSQVGTRLVADPPAGTTGPFGLAGFRDGVLFWIDSGDTVDLWWSDGTESGTRPLRRFDDLGDPQRTSLEVVGGKAAISAADGSGRFGLWTTDGTAGGTVLVKRVGSPHGFTTLNGVLYFRVAGRHGEELWRTDLSTAGTRFVRTLDARGGLTQSQLFASRGTLYLSVWDRAHGLELWRSDGTAPGTVFVKDIDPGRADSAPLFLGAPSIGREG